jgi:copper chaperone CopZ
VGKAALEGLKGIKEVKRGFHGASEINTVIYDPSIITTAEMVSALKAAGTYRGQLEE